MTEQAILEGAGAARAPSFKSPLVMADEVQRYTEPARNSGRGKPSHFVTDRQNGFGSKATRICKQEFRAQGGQMHLRQEVRLGEAGDAQSGELRLPFQVWHALDPPRRRGEGIAGLHDQQALFRVGFEQPEQLQRSMVRVLDRNVADVQ
ncbi:MAG: hypothetical protein EKK41_10680 [Hyphomicrobiales bacterium]|nr:MAG: hypothetical protein EKK41_10680 [Hyphomicrobiales bacterium]